MRASLYLDYQSTTPCDERVLEKMLPFFAQDFGNPHSRNHTFGWHAEEATEVARAHVARIIGARDPKEIVFLSGATEANNLAIQGVARFYKSPTKDHIITATTEHKCVIDCCRNLKKEGFQVTYLPVEPNGLIDLDLLRAAITDRTLLVSIMAVNNEIGVIQPLAEIGAICRERGVFFHTDAAQGVGKIPLDVEAMNIDLLSLSGHKIYGPKGIGALYVRKRPRVRLVPLIHGGGQERGLRSGTVPTPLCVGLGEACRLIEEEREAEWARLTVIRDRFWKTLVESIPQIYLNGDATARIPGNLNISFAHVEGEGLMMELRDIALSSGSACTSASLEPSYVLRALGVDEGLAHTSLRIGFGRSTSLAEALWAAERIIKAVERLRDMSPLWELSQKGIDLTTIQWSAH